jgi:hypothetical protein
MIEKILKFFRKEKEEKRKIVDRIILPEEGLNLIPRVRRKIFFYIVECENCEDMLNAVNLADINLDDGFIKIDVQEGHPQTDFISKVMKEGKYGVPSVLKNNTLYFATEGLHSDIGLMKALCKVKE